jgi:hypothetical protein
MLGTCALCEEEFMLFSKVCDECRRIKHIMNIYSKREVLDVIERVLIRNKGDIEHTIKNEKDEQNANDNSYIKKSVWEQKKNPLKNSFKKESNPP